MAETAIPYKYYQYSVNGKPYYEAGAWSNTPSGYSEIDYNSFIGGLKSSDVSNDTRFGGAKTMYDYWAGKNPSWLQAPNAPSEYSINAQGNQQMTSQIEQEKQLATDPNQLNIGTKEAPLYIPKGSPGAQLQAGLKQNPDLTPQGQFDTAMKGTPIPGTSPISPSSKFEKGFEKANAELGGKLPEGSSGMGIVNQYATGTRQDPSATFVQGDEFIGGLVQAWQDFINPANQRTSLAETYKKMIKDSGIEDIDMELVDMKRVIEGSEDDIRAELTKAGGFATDSQVLAMTNARNKQLIKNYNTLLDTRNAKEKYLNTAIGLEQADREAADQRFESMFNMGMQIADYQQKMKTNAIAGIERMVGSIGWDGILEATQGDAYAQSLIEKTYGLPKGGLVQAANQARTARKQADLMSGLDLELKRSQLATDKLQREKLGVDIKKINQEISDAKNAGSKFILQSKSVGEVKDNLSGLFDNKDIPASVREQMRKGVVLLNKLNEMVKENPQGEFAGGRFRSLLAPLIPGSSEPKFQKLKADEAKIRQDLVNYITGAAYTNLQEGDVNKIIPRSQLYDSQNKDRVNNLINTVLGDLESALIASGVDAQLPRFEDAFKITLSESELSERLDGLSESQRLELQALGLID